MKARLDHVVLWVEDPNRTLEFFVKVVGFEGVRVDEFRAGKTMFPSVRISDDSIIDLMPRRFAPKMNEIAGTHAPITANAAGHLVNHVCIAMSKTDLESLRSRLNECGVDTSVVMQNWFGARGNAPIAFYFNDPDGNVFEARYYE
jgi:catechol 2,3-dioxygenase-like lactoylglutathione lyase family enzyme